MGARGRKPRHLNVIEGGGEVVVMKRPEVPDTLTADEAQVWVEVVNSMPAAWFGRETYPLLEQYCRHTVQARFIAAMINAAISDEDMRLRGYDRLLKMQERETRAIASLAVKLRISQSTAYSKNKSRQGGGGGQKPWEED